MKKAKRAILISLALLITSVAAAGGIGVYLHSRRAEVVLTEELISGNRRAADGLTVHLETVSSGHLLWQTDYRFGEVPVSETVFSFESTLETVEAPAKVTAPLVYGDRVHRALWEDPRFNTMYEEMQREADRSTVAERTISLIDYMTVIPMQINTDVFSEGSSDIDGEAGGDAYRHTWAYVRDKLATRLTVPVDPAWTVRVTVIRDSQYGGYNLTLSGDYPALESVHIRTPNATYFVLQNAQRTDHGTLRVDSEVLGVYRLPRDPHAIGASAELVDGLELIYKPERGVQVEHMAWDGSANELLLVTNRSGGYELHTIGADGHISFLPLGNAPAGSNVRLSATEDGWVLRIAGHSLMRLVRAEDGMLMPGLMLTPEADDPLTWVIAYEHDELSFLTAGGRLAVIGQSVHRTGCGFTIAVFEDDTLAYHARYKSSLDTSLPGGEVCRPLRVADNSNRK